MTEVSSGHSYVLVNARSGTAMDLSGVDNRSIIGFPTHKGENQQWTTEWTGKSWTFRSVSSGQYLTVDGSSADGTRLVVASTPFEWHIWHDETDNTAYRIFVPSTHFNLDLYNRGDPTPGTPITLWYTYKPAVHQTWRFEHV